LGSLLCNGLAGERADPASAPAENTSTEESAEKTRNCFLKATTHQPDTSEDETSKADDGTCVFGESFE
jgi:hypothetical protein